MKIMCRSQKNNHMRKIILFQIPRKVKIEKDRVISIKKKKPIQNKETQNLKIQNISKKRMEPEKVSPINSDFSFGAHLIIDHSLHSPNPQIDVKDELFSQEKLNVCVLNNSEHHQQMQSQFAFD